MTEALFIFAFVGFAFLSMSHLVAFLGWLVIGFKVSYWRLWSNYAYLHGLIGWIGLAMVLLLWQS